MSPLLLRLLPYAAGVAVIVGGIWGYGHSRYRAGQTERTAHYQSILTKIDQERGAAEARLKAQERDSEALVVSQEKRHAESETALRARAAAAERAYARILSQRPGGGARPDPDDPASSPESPSAPGELACAGELAAAFRALGERAVRDATRLAGCQDFYNAQRDLLAR